MTKLDKKLEKLRKTYAVSVNELMLKLQHLFVLDEDTFVNDLFEEPAKAY